MNRIRIAGLVLLCLLALAACGRPADAVLCLGLNGEVVEVGDGGTSLLVKDQDETGPFGDGRWVDLSEADLLYCRFADGAVFALDRDQIQPGDQVTVGAYQAALDGDPIQARQVQLTTQRL